ncbi:MAG TPA: AraC family transcriptional regulator [Candidatus Angelobacter sp.]|nr:AraC family transcriptional regulator [Candidatus Angelobacter sp.]
MRQVFRALECGNVRVTEVSYPEGYTLARHGHGYAFLGLLLRGTYSETVAGKMEDFSRPGTLRYLPTDVMHSVRYSRGSRFLVSCIGQHLLERVADCARLRNEPGRLSGTESDDVGWRLFKEYKQNDAMSPLGVECLVMEALLRIERVLRNPGQRPSPTVLRARDLLHEGVAGPLTLDEVARQTGSHPAYLSREFRQAFRCTMSEYLRRIRVERAQDMLMKSDKPLAEIAATCGFHDQSHFTRAFRQLVGDTPTAFRRRTATQFD